ncbi:putative dolichol-phosphate mannosyltransferase [Parvularcula bermudensis HTCC2503]|uniref:Putative dolichol-phosphate mannosyltransferase n=1 Tax=Parvularcula bermudensis (strain ATCC BAA-594 / HTCC2503 / KCTC 12087) TaxID=314260 RepID=E0TBN1_PARBH|nr:glycosyltransferase family 2 protein [Parvularcula bermudensis]ADM08406.1 putative dolichol-phosphate mannosyltransferase [Parvularcula bermudensis HTCC2503]
MSLSLVQPAAPEIASPSPLRAPVALAAKAPELAVIVPVYNEAANVVRLVDVLDEALQGIAYEVVFVDDHSPDGTAHLVRLLGRERPYVRCVERLGRKGLAGACVEGVMATTAPVAVVIDGDLQHDERLIPDMLQTLRRDSLDLVVGSRYAEGGSLGVWEEHRAKASRLATRLARAATGVDLTDPMSGFFMVRTDKFRDIAPSLSTKGFKVLLDFFASCETPPKFAELGYTFRTREAGESKLSGGVVLDYIELMLDKTLGRYGIPASFVMFCAVGSIGILAHLAVLSALYMLAGVSFLTAQLIATVAAMTSNFVLNNELTYRDRRLRGWRLVPGWASFCLASSIGATANVGVASWIHNGGGTAWWLSAVAGIAVGVVFNYVATAMATWRRP